MKPPTEVTTIDEYIASFPPDTQRLLEEIRSVIRSVAPEATERISYRIPTFDWHGPLVYFAGFENHVSVYPVPRGNPELEDDLARFKGGKGTVQFPLDEPLPLDLIRRIVQYRMQSNQQAPLRTKKRKSKRNRS